MDEFERYLAKHARNPNSTPEIIKYSCHECKDTGWILVKLKGREIYRKCRCDAVRRAKELMERSGIPDEFLCKNFGNFDTQNNPQLIIALQKAVRYVNYFEEAEHGRYNSIMFTGQVGSGKTHLGMAICSRLMDEGVAVVYMAYRSAVTLIKQYITDEAAYSRKMSRYMQSRVLYIDDLLKGRVTESDVNILYEIVNYRYMNHLPLIISTEKTIEGLLEFDEAVASRMIEMCRGNIVKFQGKELNYRI